MRHKRLLPVIFVGVLVFGVNSHLLESGDEGTISQASFAGSRAEPRAFPGYSKVVHPLSDRPESFRETLCGRPSTQLPDFPETYISEIHVDLTSPSHLVTLTWAGPLAERGETGPFLSSPGAGRCGVDCDRPGVSRVLGSKCTPKGRHQVEGFSCHFPGESSTATYFDYGRGIAFHYHPDVPGYPVSNGCVHLDLHPAQLIYDNTRSELTQVIVEGTWTPGPECIEVEALQVARND